jgi:hypothetical protein
MWTNILVACTNLVALPLIFTSSNSRRWWMLFPMLASFLYHLAETKHGLPGVKPLNAHAARLLWLDRFGAFGSALYIVLTMYNRPHIFTLPRLCVATLGLASLWYSERDICFVFYHRLFGKTLTLSDIPPTYRVGQSDFAVSHSCWHFSAFYTLSIALG